MARNQDNSSLSAEADDTVIGGTDRETGGRPELSSADVQKRLWSQPGGEERAMREAVEGTEADTDGQTDAVERETPGDTVQRISDPTIRPAKG